MTTGLFKTGLPATDRLLGTAFSTVRLLYDDRTWKPKGAARTSLESLSARHLRNIRGWLFGRVETLAVLVDATCLAPFAPEDVPLIADQYRDPTEWLVGTPLVKRIDALLEADEYAAVMAACDPVTIHG